MENIIQTRNPEWVFNTANTEYIHTGTGECISPSEYEDMELQKSLHKADLAVSRNCPTVNLLNRFKDSLLDLKSAFLRRNKWEEDPNPNQEIGETGTGFWQEISRAHCWGSRVVDRNFVHQAGCENRIHPTETDVQEFHNPSPIIQDLLDCCYILVDQVIRSYAISGAEPNITDHLSILKFLLDGLHFDAISIEVGDSSISEILSQQDKTREYIVSLKNQLEQQRVRQSELVNKLHNCEEELVSARKVKTWLWEVKELNEKKISFLNELLSKAASLKKELRSKLYARNVGQKNFGRR